MPKKNTPKQGWMKKGKALVAFALQGKCFCDYNQQNEKWYCVKIRNGIKKICDGPFDNQQECEECHDCRKDN